MVTTNPHTGDEIKTKPASDKYRDNYDAIFRKPVKETKEDAKAD